MAGTARNLLILGIEVLAVSLVSWAWAFKGIGTIEPTRVESVAQGILQVVSFLVAGYTAGAFLLYGRWESELARLSENLFKTMSSAGLKAFQRSKDEQTIVVFGLLFAPLIWFAASGFSAISALASGAESYDKVALGALGIGFGFMPLTFYSIHSTIERVRTAIALSPSQPGSSPST